MNNVNNYTRPLVPTVVGGFSASQQALPAASKAIQAPSQALSLPQMYGAALVLQKPLDAMPGDVLLVIKIGVKDCTWNLQCGKELPNICTGFRVVGMTKNDGRTKVNINGQGNRTCYDGDVFDGIDIKRIEISSRASGLTAVSMILQAWGYGGGGGIVPNPVVYGLAPLPD